jgi:beta-lactamase superfamily II metal-dependent hydrolase
MSPGAPAGSPASVVKPVQEETLRPPAPAPGSALVEAIEADPAALVYVLLNVGDGDTQLFLLPRGEDGAPRRLLVVDVATTRKLPALLTALAEAGVLAPPGTTDGQLALLVATHPHHDHIGGMVDLLGLDRTGRWVDQFWDPGYYFPSPSFHNLMRALEDRPALRRLQPTAGTSLFLDSVRITVLGPNAALRMRFDTYGVQVNDASLTLMVEFPATRVFREQAPDRPGEENRRVSAQRNRRLLLGADAQFASWAQTVGEFPDLHNQMNPVLQRELRKAIGKDPLRANVFKLSHHASKHGVNIELLQRVGAELALVSSSGGGGRYNFPHMLAMEAAREARQATTQSQAARSEDAELGIHLTGSLSTAGASLGSIAAVIPPQQNRPIRLFRLMDQHRDAVALGAAREVVPPKA